MTTLYADMVSVSTELRQIVGALTPRSRASDKFTTSKALDEGTDWKDIEAVPRLFQIEWSPAITAETFGAAHYRATVKGALSIWYPLRGWRTEMLGDAEQIISAIKGLTGSGGGASSVANCSYRLVDMTSEITTEEIEDGLWMAIPLIALMAVEQS